MCCWLTWGSAGVQQRSGVLALVLLLQVLLVILQVLRVVEALQFCDANGEVCPASWTRGEKGIKPEVFMTSFHKTAPSPVSSSFAGGGGQSLLLWISGAGGHGIPGERFQEAAGRAG